MDTRYLERDYREIDISDMMWEYAVQWKPALLCAIIFAILLSGMMYLRAVSAYRGKNSADTTKQSINDLSEEELDGRIEDIRSGLSQKEADDVELTMSNLITQRFYEDNLSYIAEAGLSGNSIRFYTARYRVATEDGSSVAGLLNSYAEMLEDASLKDSLSRIDPKYKAIIKVMDPAGMSDLITDMSDTNTFSVDVVLPEGVSETEIGRLVSDHMKEMYRDLAVKMPHELTELTHFVKEKTNKDILNRTADYQKGIVSYKTTAMRNAESFTDAQNKYYILLQKKEGLAESVSDDMTEAGNKKESTGQSVILPKKTFLKYLLIGFVLGAAFYGVSMMGWYIIRGRARTLREVAERYMIREIDEVHFRGFDSAFRRFMYSKPVYDLRYRAADKEVMEHAASALDHIERLSRHQQLEQVTVIPAYGAAGNSMLIDRYVDHIKGHGNDTKVGISVCDPLKSTKKGDVPAEGEGVIMMIKENDTTFRSMDDIYRYCLDYSLHLLGAILVED